MPRQNVSLTATDFRTLGSIDFDSGTGPGIAAGATIDQGVQHGYVHKVTITSGDWATDDAAGRIIYHATSNGNFVPGTVTSGATTITATAVTGSGNYDGRFKKIQYMAVILYTPNSAAKVSLLDAHLTLLLPNTTPTPLGFTLDANDELQVPLKLNQGRRHEGREAGWFCYAAWDDSSGKLVIAVGWQGLEGDGDGVRTVMPAYAYSIDAANDLCGDLVDLDLSSLSFAFSFETTDTSPGGSNSKQNPRISTAVYWYP